MHACTILIYPSYEQCHAFITLGSHAPNAQNKPNSVTLGI